MAFRMETQTKMRIYVGGLGETVTEQDLRNTFSKSGTVEAVEFVRTKDRSFAYIDFRPSSDKSVAKLFSTYNGCAWKGGKLRLEKAKLHYLERLKREWEEDADLARKTHDDDDDDDKNVDSSVGQEEALDESSQIHMFFPRLRKVKSLPYKGTGKHKYSFQRIEASAHPIHFCDCAEHADQISTTHIRHTNTQDGGMNEDEINMMNSVLSKFLGRVVAPSNHLPEDQNHNGDSIDDDNIIINAVAGPDDVTQLLESMKKQTGVQTKMARSKKPQTQNNFRIQKGKDKNPRKKGKLAQVKGSDKEVEFSIPNTKQTWINQLEQQPESLNTEEESGRKQSTGNASLSPSKPGASNKQPESGADDLPNGDSKVASVVSNMEQLNEAADTDQKNVASDKPSRSMSWMKLVSSANNSPFSLSQILPETNVSKKSTRIASSQRTGINKNSINPVLKRTREISGEGLDFGTGNWMATSENINMQGHGKKRQKLDIEQSAAPEGDLLAKANNSNENNCASASGSKSNSQEAKTISSDLQISGTCPFMRTDSSVKDKMRTKGALSASLKKKNEQVF